MKKGRVNEKYEEKYIKSNRTFPVGRTIGLVILVTLQLLALMVAVFYTPKPQDKIQQYQVMVEPRNDGTLDIVYRFVWKALDETEPLSWVEIGMANDNYTVYPDLVSDNISFYSQQSEDGYTTLRLDFDRCYYGGDVLEFYFTINQRDMLCKEVDGYFFEFIPGWFNATPVTHYEFKWNAAGSVEAENAKLEDGYYVWDGSFDCGGYEKMVVHYDNSRFNGCSTVNYQGFDDSGAYDELIEDKVGVCVLMGVLIVGLMVVEIYIVDCYVSYYRGRGFMTGYGYHIHTYGRSNPWYIKERDKRAAQNTAHSHGRSHGGGCACACACACAGGGRAGCSQKDGFGIKK